jgi:predicted HicB family RNase H-like nuclease
MSEVVEQSASNDVAETPDLNTMVTAYLKLRNAIEEKEEAHKAAIQELKNQFELIGNELLAICNKENIDSIKTPVGTISRRVSSRYWTSDWDSMYQFIREHDAPFLLEQRIHNSNMREFLETNPDFFPPGLQAERKYAVQVRKPTKK